MSTARRRAGQLPASRVGRIRMQSRRPNPRVTVLGVTDVGGSEIARSRWWCNCAGGDRLMAGDVSPRPGRPEQARAAAKTSTATNFSHWALAGAAAALRSTDERAQPANEPLCTAVTWPRRGHGETSPTAAVQFALLCESDQPDRPPTQI